MPLYVCIMPEIDWRSLTSAAKSAPVCEWSRFGGEWSEGWRRSWWVPDLKRRPSFCVEFRYWMRRLRAFQYLSVGFFGASERRLERKHMSGLVESAMYVRKHFLVLLCVLRVLASDSIVPYIHTPSFYGVCFPFQAAMYIAISGSTGG